MIKKLIDKFFTREIITYLIAGVLTTLINMLVSYIMYNILKIDENLTTIVAWIVAVIFAYFINNYWVFLQGSKNRLKEATKFTKFIGSRLFTLLVEEAGVFIFITKLQFNFWLIKVFLMIIVTILNYVLSKLIVFKRRTANE